MARVIRGHMWAWMDRIKEGGGPRFWRIGKEYESSQPERPLTKSVEVGDTDIAAGEALDG